MTPRLAVAVLLLALAAMPAVEAGCVGADSLPIRTGGTNGAVAVVTANLDADPVLEVVVASFGDDTIAWFDAADPADPVFSKHVITSEADSALGVFVGDVDGDTLLDVVSASANDNTIAWYRNDGTTPPTFTEHIVTLSASRASAVFAANLDGDADLDILSASTNDDTIAWYETGLWCEDLETACSDDDDCDGTCSLRFPERIITTGADGASSVFAIDLNGDGDIDVLSASQFDDTIAWYENGLWCEDLETACAEASDCTDIGDATCERRFPERIIGTSADGARSVHAGDIDGDDDIDVVSASSNDAEIAWYENDGGTTPSFSKRLVANDALGAASVSLADIDGDTHMDILAAATFDDAIRWYRHDGNRPPEFTEQTVAAVLSADSAVAADINADGTLDVVTASSVPGSPARNDSVVWFEGPGFAQRPIAGATATAESIAVIDLDGDGDTDVLAATLEENLLAWYENDGAAEEPSFTERTIAADDATPSSVFAANLNSGDTFVDVVATYPDDDRISWYQNLGGAPPTFVERNVTTNADGASDVIATALNDDSDVDLVSVSREAGTLFWHESDGADPPTFTDRLITDEAAGARAVHADDLDADGDTDLLVARDDDFTGGIFWFDNDGTAEPTFTETRINFGIADARSVHSADLDGDGDPDVLAAFGTNNRISWFENGLWCEDLLTACASALDCDGIGEGTCERGFPENLIAAGIVAVNDVFAADLDDDGDLDVLAAAAGSDLVAWYVNDGEAEPFFSARVVSDDAEGARAVTAAALDGGPGLDVVTAARFELRWHPDAEEICGLFDANADGWIDGVELSWIGRAFGLSRAMIDPPDWWDGVDLNDDLMIDGEDLAILASSGVFGRTTADCRFVCQ